MAQWFGPKVDGYGTGVRSWQGWATVIVTLALIIGSRFVSAESLGLPSWSRQAFLGVVILAFIGIVCLTYEDD